MSDQNTTQGVAGSATALNMLVAAAISQGRKPIKSTNLKEKSVVDSKKEKALTPHAQAVVDSAKKLSQEQKLLVVKEILNLKSTEPTGLPSLNPLPLRRHICDYPSQQKCEEHVLIYGAKDLQSASMKQVIKESIGPSSRFLYRYERDGSGKLGDWFLTLYQ